MRFSDTKAATSASRTDGGARVDVVRRAAQRGYDPRRVAAALGLDPSTVDEITAHDDTEITAAAATPRLDQTG
jgi:hypothetical protein